MVALQDELRIMWLTEKSRLFHLVEYSLLLETRAGVPSQMPWDVAAYAELRADAMPGQDGRYARRIWFFPEEVGDQDGDSLHGVVNARFITAGVPSLRADRIDWLSGRNVSGAAIPL